MQKIISYLGFANKSNKLIAGQTPLKHCTKTLYLVMVCGSASQNLLDLANNVAKKHNCECIVTNCPLSELTNIENVKIVGLTDENLSKAIINYKEKINIG